MIARLRTFYQQHQDLFLIVARGGAQGAGGSARDRLLGTLAGAAVGLAAAALHNLGVPDWLLLFFSMAPMGFLSADKAAFRVRHAAANPAIHLEALPFLWETLRDDLAELAVLTAALKTQSS